MKKILFIDRDGTLVEEPPVDLQLDSFEKLKFLPYVFKYLGKIAEELEYELVMVSNQDGLGTRSFPKEKFLPVQFLILNSFQNEGIKFREILIDDSFESNPSPNRKPAIGMVKHYMGGNFDLENSYVIGDRLTDYELAKNMGCKAILINQTKKMEDALNVNSWQEIYQFLSTQNRKAKKQRISNETNIEVQLNLDGTGKNSINTGIPFFDHMLEQIAKHAIIDMDIFCKGDLHIDEHHSIEDVGICFGEAFAEALGTKKLLERYAFVLPMDDCKAEVVMDLGGRASFQWEADFLREKVGDMPTEMFDHFFKSFSDAVKCNLFIKADGKNEHHKIESIFKAFGRALKIAISKDPKNGLPSTKGSL